MDILYGMAFRSPPCSQNCIRVHSSFFFPFLKVCSQTSLGFPPWQYFLIVETALSFLYKTACLVLTLLLSGFPFPSLLEDVCLSSHSSTRIHDPTHSLSPVRASISHPFSSSIFPICVLTFLVSSILKIKPKERKTCLRPCYFL